MSLIENKIKEIQDFVLKKQGLNISEEQAFNILNIQHLCMQEKDLEKVWFKIENSITDGSNDGGIDYVFYDEEESKLLIGQSKYSENVDVNVCVSEIDKILDTIKNFHNTNTGKYNHKLKLILQNNIDRLSEDNISNIDIIFVSLKQFNYEDVNQKILDRKSNINEIIFIDNKTLEEKIDLIDSLLETVDYYKIDIDQAGNRVKYETDKYEGVFVNISSQSLTKLYNNYSSRGLFNLNIRKYIRNKTVDDGIKNTLDQKRDEFWFLNNGITIACKNFIEDGNTYIIEDFSIVNGGQTTSLIGNYKGNNNKIFYIPCKIIKSKESLSNEVKFSFYNTIAEATNSQKPIMAKDLKSNTPEMRALKKLLSENDINLVIKRGDENPINRLKYKIKNDVFAQLVFSFVHQKPGTSRNNKNQLFSSSTNYEKIFLNRYHKDNNKRNFIIDLIKLNERYDILEEKIKFGADGYTLDANELDIMNNGKLIILAVFGVFYRIMNNDIKIEDVVKDPKVVSDLKFFHYGSFLSNYSRDDIDEKFKYLSFFIIQTLASLYADQLDMRKVTSVSNFFKTDLKYMEDIILPILKKIYRDEEYNKKFFDSETGACLILKRNDN